LEAAAGSADLMVSLAMLGKEFLASLLIVGEWQV
jgi:hypothetical protein